MFYERRQAIWDGNRTLADKLASDMVGPPRSDYEKIPIRYDSIIRFDNKIRIRFLLVSYATTEA